MAAGDYAHVQGSHITTPQTVEVIAPLPGRPWSDPVAGVDPATPAPVEGIAAPVVGGQTPAAATAEPAADPAEQPLERMLTFTTCHPMYSNAERLIVHAALVETTAKAGGRAPTALKE